MANFFLEIVNMSITASYLIVAVVLLRLILNKAPKWIRGILWGLVGIRLVIPFSFESAFSLIPSSSLVPSVNELQGASDGNTGNLPPVWDFSTGAGATPQSTDVVGIEAPITEVSQAGDISLTTILAIIWLVGLAAMLVYCAASYLRLNKRVADAVIYRGGKNVIYQSEKVDSPFVLGFFFPRIYLPFKMDATDMDCVIAHEKAHITRKDHWMKPIAFIILAVYWFNPLVWIAYILLCRDIELACDEKVIKEMGVENKKQYSEALLKCSVPQRLISACPLAFGEVGVKKRIVNVLHYKKPAFWIILVSLILCVVVAVCFMTKPKAETIPYINDGSVDWENVSEIVIYSDGYYGRTMEEPLVITDENELKEILDATLNSDEYKEVAKGEQLEGLGAIFIDYQNGAVISMYSEPNYGMISDTIQTTGATCYYVPRDLYDTVIDLLIKHENDTVAEELQGSFEAVTSVHILKEPPTMTLQDALSSTMNFFDVKSGTYDWTYPSGNPDEMITINACGAFPTEAVKGKEDEWIQVRDYNGIDYAPYMLNWGIDPDRIQVVEYDLLDLGDTKPEVLSEQWLEDVYFLELRPRRIYEVVAEWDEGSNGNGFYGYATYIFATDNYAVSTTESEGEEWPVLIQATVKEVLADSTDKICITSESENFPGAFVVRIPEDVYPRDTLQGGQQIMLSMFNTGEMYDEHLPLYEALILSVRPEGVAATSEEGETLLGMNLPAVVETPWEYEVNALDGVELVMEKYSATGGDLEIVNELRKKLQGGEWFTIQREIDGKWYNLVYVYDTIAFKDVGYILPAGETTILPITWEWIYGELPAGEYRVVTKVLDYRAPGDYDEYYLAKEFEIMKSY